MGLPTVVLLAGGRSQGLENQKCLRPKAMGTTFTRAAMVDDLELMNQ
jgi:hypothetical protein